ncbi:hypothetical protein ACIBEJ_34605 [Nonomuraea sp. NPDC050790]|uniref:hypothetical protein n=1 Tax=Nonomuraea sp. NPDC050790 TaxID=3364371 RepID=UPI0037A5F7C2
MRGLDEQGLEWRIALGTHMEERRTHLGLTWQQVSENSGISTQALRDIREKTGGIRKLTKRGIEKALAWKPGSIDRILEGKPPIEDDDAWPPEIHSIRIVPGPASGADSHTVQRWFKAELGRRGLELLDITAPLDTLRAIADHNDQTLGELLIEAGVAVPEELIVRRPGAAAITQFQQDYERIMASPHLSRSERRALEKQHQEALENLEKGGGDA